jgi:uncharacterized protein
VKTNAQKKAFSCMKCQSALFKSGELRGSGGALSSIFDVSTEKFFYVSCANCGFTEFYRGGIGSGTKAADFWMG